MTLFNKKLEDSPWKSRITPKYPYATGETDILGKSETNYANPNAPNDASSEIIQHDGSFETKEISAQKNGLLNRLYHNVRDYIAGGSSQNTDGQIDISGQSNQRTNIKQDNGVSVGGEHYQGVGGKVISGSKDPTFNHNTNGDTFTTSSGNVVSQHDGHSHESFNGDKIQQVSGNKHTIIESGECGLHVQGGNLDYQVDGGKLRLKSGLDLIITSDTTITLKVGASVIVISPNKITINADKVYIN